MSVAAQSQRKRFFDAAEENEDRYQRLSESGGFKRAKQGTSPSGGRCAPEYLHHRGASAYAIGQSTVAALRALFPEMNDKVIADVLAEYGENIDAAIKHLTDLRLSQAQSPPEAATQQPQQQQQQEQQQEQQGAEAQAGAGAAAAAAGVDDDGQVAGAAPSAQQQQQQQQQQRRRSAAEWVDAVVEEMSRATSMVDAKSRASAVLQAFEQAALQHAKEQGGDTEKLRAQLTDVLRENAILKRAVAIQNSRMPAQAGGAGANGREGAELAQLRAALEQYQQRCHALEMQNYSLAMHLKQATDGTDPLGKGVRFNPDVF